MTQSKSARWWQFTRERFDPISHLIMITLFVATHILVATALSSSNATLKAGVPLVCALWLGSVCFFFKLRLYDEIKDYELDCVINPTRPLARGLLQHSDLYRGIALCILLELVCFGFAGLPGVVGITFTILYSLMMYKEFFIPKLIRPHLTTYAVSHTIVSSFLSLTLLAALTSQLPWLLNSKLLYFALNSWFLFNVFEFGRKTFLSAEERDGVESYSKIFGRTGAALLTLSMATGSTFCLFSSLGSLNETETSSLRGLLLMTDLGVLVLGLLYAFKNQRPYGKLFRSLSSFYIVWVYASVLLFLRGSIPW